MISELNDVCFFELLILIVICVLGFFFWKNCVREKVDVVVFGLSGWNDVNLILFLELVIFVF